MRPDVAIIGAGPAGLLLATRVAEKGFKAHIFEEHSQIGSPVHCAGLISIEGFKKLGIRLDDSFVQNKVRGGRIYSPDGKYLELSDNRFRAIVVDRGNLDRYLAEMAVDAGVCLETGVRVDEVLFDNKSFHGLKTKEHLVEAALLVDAEGAGGRLLKKSGLDTGQSGLLTGFNVEVGGVDVDLDLVEVWFGENYSKDFFTWVIPIDENRVRCGLGTSRSDGLESLKHFIKKRFGVDDVSNVNSGRICIGGPIRKTVYNGLMLVGDTAGQVKATTGGGVVMGGLCAQIAGDTAVKALEEEDYSAFQLGMYEKGWRDSYEFELMVMLAARKMMNRIKDTQFNRMFKVFREEGFQEQFNRLIAKGDMDMQADIIKTAILDPRFLNIIARSIGRVALGELMSFFR